MGAAPTSSTGLSTTRVADFRENVKLDIRETILELLRELEGWEYALSGRPWFSTRDRVSWVCRGFDILGFGCDCKVGEDEMSAPHREVDVRVRAAAFAQSTDSASVIRVDEEVGIANAL